MTGFRVLLAVLLLGCAALPARAQTAEELGSIFFSMDRNRDGVIELSEVPDSSLPVFRAMLKEYDANKNLKLTLEECHLTRGALPAESAPRGVPVQNPPPAAVDPQQAPATPPVPPAAAPPAVDSADALFNQLDTNHDGIISRREAAGTPLLPLFNQLQIAQLDLATFRGLQGRKNRNPEFNPMDASGAPRLGALHPVPRANPPEVRVVPPQNNLPAEQNPPVEKPASRGLIAVLDKDGNGKLTVLELALLPRVFSSLDLDGDAELDEAELLGARQAASPAAAPAMTPPAAPENPVPQPEAPVKPVEQQSAAPEQPAAAPVAENPAVSAATENVVLKMFKPNDIDGDGFVTEAERPDWWLSSVFTAMDADHDGKVSREEYSSYFTRNQRRPTGDANPPME